MRCLLIFSLYRYFGNQWENQTTSPASKVRRRTPLWKIIKNLNVALKLPRISCSISENDDMFQNCFNFIINFVKAVLSECNFNRLVNFKAISLKNLSFSLFSFGNRHFGLEPAYGFMCRSACPVVVPDSPDLPYKIDFLYLLVSFSGISLPMG